MPGNIYHFVLRETHAQSKEDKDKDNNIKENYKDINLDQIWHDKYDIKPKLTMNERIVKICKILSNEFEFDLLY